MGGLGLELPPCFWKRICGGQDFVYTLEDIKQMDKYRYDDLTRLVESKETCQDDETFAMYYDGYTFEADFGEGSVPLCDGGLEKPLQRNNIDEYIKLYLKKYTEMEDLQYKCIMQGINDVCGKRLMMHMLPHLAGRRACASSKIDMKALKAVTRLHAHVHGDQESTPEQRKEKEKAMIARFWKVIESFSNDDRSLFVKFATGRQRLA